MDQPQREANAAALAQNEQVNRALLTALAEPTVIRAQS